MLLPLLKNMHLDLAIEQVQDHLATRYSDRVIQGNNVQGGEEGIGKSERQHERDPA
jgi:hypothetical protein